MAMTNREYLRARAILLYSPTWPTVLVLLGFAIWEKRSTLYKRRLGPAPGCALEETHDP
jgi:hypothetical protein